MQPGSRSAFGVAPSSRRSSATADTPLTAERAMMDQIRFKLERAQRRLARNAPSSNSSNNSNYIPSSQYRSAVHKPPVRSVRVEDAVGPPSTLRHHGLPAPPPSSRRVPPPPPSSKYQQLKPPPSSRVAYAPQYKSRSKYAHGSLQDAADPLNGGPPPMSTPFLVYSNTRPPMTGSYHSRTPDTARHRAPPSGVNPPPSALKSRVARPPSSRVRFEDLRASIDKKQEEEEAERRHRKEREARHLRHREQEINARAKGTGPASPISAATRGRRSASLEKPPSSAIKASAYEDIAQTIPTSPVGRPRRSSVNNPPPKSDIDVSAFDVLPRRRGAAGQDKAPKPEQKEEAPVDTTDVVETDAEGHSSESDNQETAEQETAEPPPVQLAVELPPPSVVPEPNAPSSDEDVDGGGASDSDDSLYERSDFDTDSEYLSSGYSMFNAHVLEVDVQSDSSDEEIPTEKPASSNQESEDEDVPPPPASELSTVDEEDDDEEPQPASRLTARDLAFLALGRASSCSFSDFGSPVSSASGKNSPKPKPAPMSYAPASSAFPRSRAGRPPAPATTGRTRVPPPSSSTSVSSYVRRSRARAPMDLKNQLPPSIGVLSGLSSGSSTFVMDPSCFYDVTWKLGEFAFSVQRVYTEENEFEFDDRNQEPQLFLRMLLNTERSTCKSFRDVRLGDVLIRVGDSYVSDLGLEGSGTVLTKFFAKLTARTPIKLTFQRMCPNDWEGGVEL